MIIHSVSTHRDKILRIRSIGPFFSVLFLVSAITACGGGSGQGGDQNGSTPTPDLEYLAGNDGVNDFELWVTDGTSAGTKMVRDINPMGESFPDGFTEFAGNIYFRADDGTNGYELWRTDGTDAGTEMVADLLGGGGASPFGMTVVGDKMFFVASNDLYVTDGTLGSAVALNATTPRTLTSFGSLLIFSAQKAEGREPWVSDGTTTQILKDIIPGNGSSSPGDFVEFDGAIYFIVRSGGSPNQLWKTDGTPAGTVQIPLGVTVSFISQLTVVGSNMYLVASVSGSGSELWKFEGDATGISMVKDINPGVNSSSPNNLTPAGSILYLTADDGTSGPELWKSDGTDLGTVMVKDIGSAAVVQSPDQLFFDNGTLYFRASNGTDGFELWKSDGTDVGTSMVKDIRPGPSSSGPFFFSALNGLVLFSAEDDINGLERWRTDGTEAGTQLIKDINPGVAWGVAD